MAEKSRSRKAVYWTLFLLCSAVAVWRIVLATDGGSAQLPDTPESAQPFICRECGHVFSLTPRGRTELMTRRGRIVREEMTAVRRTLLPCPACGAVEAVVGRTCPNCGRPFVGTDQDGGRHLRCPDCEAADARPDGRGRAR
ncbi:MAG TPA: hypothetical protein VM243_08980 [Phycisphaerae bacterium]|nr:hypothetical protein [Phycisphaerae bacterium]